MGRSILSWRNYTLEFLQQNRPYCKTFKLHKTMLFESGIDGKSAKAPFRFLKNASVVASLHFDELKRFATFLLYELHLRPGNHYGTAQRMS